MASQVLREVMTKSPCALHMSATLRDAAEVMREHAIGGVVVTDDDGRFYGFVTDRDLVVRGIAQGYHPIDTPLTEVVSREIAFLSPNDTVDDAIGLMAAKAIRRIPILENGVALGIVSIGDLAQAREERSALSKISSAPPNV